MMQIAFLYANVRRTLLRSCNKSKTDYPGGMYLSIDDPKRSLRYITNNGEKLILIGGESHKTGQGINTMLHYEALYSFAEATFE